MPMLFCRKFAFLVFALAMGATVPAAAATWTVSLDGPAAAEVGVPFDIVFGWDPAPSADSGWDPAFDSFSLTWVLDVDGVDRSSEFPIDPFTGGSHTIGVTPPAEGLFQVTATGSISYQGVREQTEEVPIFDFIFNGQEFEPVIIGYQTVVVQVTESFGTFGFNEFLDIAVSEPVDETVSAVPLPAGGFLLLSALAGIVLMRRRSQNG